MAKNNDLLFSVGVEEAELKALEKRLTQVVDVLQKAMAIKTDPLAPLFKGASDGAPKATKALSDLEKAARSLSAAQKVVVAEQKAGLITQDQAIVKLKGLSAEYSKTAKSTDGAERGYKELTTALGTTVTATGRLEAAQVKSQKAFRDDEVRQYRDAQNNLRTELERGAISVDRYRTEANDLQNEMVELRDTLPRTSKEFGNLDRVIGQNTRGITTAEGRVSKLGLSQQVALGSTRNLGRGFVGLNQAVLPLIGVAGLGGLVKVMGGFVGEAQRAQSAAIIFDKAILRTGQNAGEADALVEELSDTFGVLPGVVEEAAAPILRAGGSIEDVSNALFGAGASAAAGSRDISNAFVNIGRAVATGRSELTEAADVMVNSSDAYKDYAAAIGVSVDSLTEQQKVQAFSAAIMEESRFELEDLDAVLTDQVKTQQAFRTSLAEARQELGTKFAPTLTLGTQAAIGLLNSFEGLPDGAQASVVGIGGVTTGVAALATGLTALRPLLAATFLPPAGLIVLGIAAAAALGTAMVTLGDGALKGAAAEVDNLKTSLETSAQGFATAKAAVTELQDVTDKDGFLGVVETLASTLDEKGASSLKAFAESTALPLIAQGELQKALELTVEKFGVFEAEAARAGLQGAEQQIELSRNRVNLLEREITYLKQLTNGDFSYAGLNPTPSDIQALNNYEGQLVSVKTQMQTSQVAADGYRGQLKTVQEAQAALNDESLTSEDRLAGFADALGLAADFSADVAVAGSDAADGVTEVTEAATGAGDAAETSATKTGELTDELEKLDPALRAVVSAQAEYQNSRIDVILQDEASALRATLTAQQEYYDSRIEGARLASEASAKAAAQAARDGDLEQQAFSDRAKSRDAIVEANERAAESASVYDDAAQTVYTTQDAAISQNERGIASLTDLITAQGDFNERLEISGGLWKDVTPEASDFSTVLAELNAEARRADDVLRNYAEGVLEDLPDLYEDAADLNDVFNEGLSDAEVRAEVAKEALEELIDAGLDPQSEAVQEAADEWEKYQTEVDAATELSEALTEAQEGLGDASSLTQTDIDDLRTSLLGTADATGELSVDAQGLLSDLNALDVAQGLSTGFASIGDSARLALEGIPGLSDAAKGGLQGIANASDVMSEALKDGVVTPQEGIAALGGLVDGLADGFRDDLSPGAYAAVKAIDGVASAAVSFATGDIIGGVTTLIGTAVQGITDYFQEAQREAEELLAIAKQIDDALKDSQERTRDLKLGSAFDQNQLEFDTGQIDELAFILRETQLKLIEEQLEFNEALEDAGRRRSEALVGVTNPDDIARINAGFDAEEKALKEGHATNQAAIIEGGRAQAEAAEYSDQEFLGGLTKTDSLIEGAFGNSGASFFAAVDNYTAVTTGALSASGTSLSAAGTQMGSTASVGIQGGGTAINNSTLSVFGAVRNLLGAQTDTTITAQGGAGVSLAGGWQKLFGVQDDAITSYYPQVVSATDTAFQGIGSSFKNGSQTLTGSLNTGEGVVGGALSSFFGSQRTAISTQGGRTVTEINTAAGDIREAMRRLVAAAAVKKSHSLFGFGGRSGGGGGGSGGNSNPGFFAPMHSFVDERALGGMSDGFGTLDTWGIAADNERNQFGFGTSFSQPVQPVGDSYQGGRNAAGPLSGLLASVRAGVEAYKLGTLSSINSARETQRRGFSALGYDFRKGLIDEAKRNGKAVKKTKDEYKQMKKDFLDSFDFLNGSGLLKSIGGVKSPLFDLAKDIGTQVESGFKGGLTEGAKGFIFGTGGIQESLAKMTFDTTVNSLLTTVLSSGLLEKLFDGAYTNLTKKLVQGDIQGAIEAMKGVLGKLPQVTGQLEQIFAPLRDAAKGLGFYEQPEAPSFNNLAQGIRLEARSLGSATPNWVLDMGRHFDTFGKSADLTYKAALIMDRAARRMDSGTRLYEINKPRKLV